MSEAAGHVLTRFIQPRKFSVEGVTRMNDGLSSEWLRRARRRACGVLSNCNHIVAEDEMDE